MSRALLWLLVSSPAFAKPVVLETAPMSDGKLDASVAPSVVGGGGGTAGPRANAEAIP